ncbi:PQQ-dependent sugar dehydrogenase [Nisaea acidiphila]|uniref:PQQ-dependent sugar dehydrogenase n=1 Tax=Nisaea acidiphila TaxID=1862145 RepID=A0A9J7AXE0_9PROT|nr:PQQ-dependent sugar dehydrogenase [Nisaea acidiphila]UUX51782.1 PQQ-dependent sugar dehydrogenase [Nisaea acidiphila]
MFLRWISIARLFFFAMAALLLASCSARSPQAVEIRLERSERHDFRIVPLAAGLEHPWGLAFLPDGRILVTEREGDLRIVGPDGLAPEPVGGVPDVYASGQGGLLDVALHPDFAANGLIYLSYAGRGPGGAGTEVVRARFTENSLKELEVIFRQRPKVSGGRHFGSRLAFAPDGTLFISMGDRGGYMREAQSLASHIGTVVRLNDDGSVPEDNPFAGRGGALPEIFSYGHRNVQGMALRPGTDTIWAHEHGPRGGDEVNILRPGRNYGWPAITYGIDYSGAIISDKTAAPGMEQPVVYWVPSIAPSGMDFYRGDEFPNWRGNLFVGALARTHLRRLTLEGDRVVGEEKLLEGLEERIRAVKQGPDGLLYVLTDSPDGQLLRLEPVR